MKKTTIPLLFILIFLGILVFVSCERDDICPAETLTTPRLVIRFNDKENPSTNKVVTRLKIFGLLDLEQGPALSTIDSMTTDSINLPLRTSEDTSIFVLIRDSQEDENGNENGNRDTLIVDYQRREIFVNRGCGFKVNYDLDTLTTSTMDNDKWIAEDPPILINSPTVENEASAHVTIYH